MSNKQIISLIFMGISFLILFIGLILVYPAFIINHEYYKEMFTNSSNINLIIGAFMLAVVPLVILIFTKNLYKFMIGLLVGLIIFGYIYISSKSGGLIGSGFAMWPLNLIIMMFFVVVFLSFLMVFGRWLKIKIFRIKENNLFGLINGFGFGLVFFLLINYILILSNLYYPFVTWLIFFGMIAILILLKDLFFDSLSILSNFVKNVIDNIWINKVWAVFYGLLFIFSVMYFYYGFMMSWIPYPTAWDANHAYMFYPKMWALNNGFYWNELNMNTQPYLWLGYIAFWFSLFLPFSNNFWINADTFAVVMNFFSGIFVLVFAIALIGNFVFKDEKNEDGNHHILFLTAWAIIIAWLTSGMGAFLVFVDNKTDLGVLSLIILALYSGFLLFKYLYENRFNIKVNFDFNSEDIAVRLAIFSALFFAVAVASKPTAFFDVVNFVIFTIFSVFSHGLAVAVFFLVVAFLAFIKMRGVVDYITPYGAKIFGYIGGILTILGIGELIYRFKANWNKFANLVVLMLIWGVSFFVFLVLIKGLWVGLEIIYYDKFQTLSDVFKAIIF